MILISMTDFVLNQGSILKTYVNHLKDPLFDNCINYANFLKQTLTLEMFIGDKALFEGFKQTNEYVITNDKGDGFIISKMHELTIESCIYLDLTLTEYAIKELGL